MAAFDSGHDDHLSSKDRATGGEMGTEVQSSTLLFFCFFHVFEELASLLQANGVDVSQESMYWSGMWHRIHSLAFCEHFAAMVCLDVDRTKWAACLVAWTMKVMASMMWS